jgi:hypothetical protein
VPPAAGPAASSGSGRCPPSSTPPARPEGAPRSSSTPRSACWAAAAAGGAGLRRAREEAPTLRAELQPPPGGAQALKRFGGALRDEIEPAPTPRVRCRRGAVQPPAATSTRSSRARPRSGATASISRRRPRPRSPSWQPSWAGGLARRRRSCAATRPSPTSCSQPTGGAGAGDRFVRERDLRESRTGRSVVATPGSSRR